MSYIRKRHFNTDGLDKRNKKRRTSANKGVSFYIPLNVNIATEVTDAVPVPVPVPVPVSVPRPLEELKYTQAEVTALLATQEQVFRQLLEDKLKEQFNMFNQLYIDNIFKEYTRIDCSYIN
jgi:hypothetical protein